MWYLLAGVALFAALCTFAYADNKARQEKRRKLLRPRRHPFRRHVERMTDAELRTKFYEIDPENDQ